MGYNPHKQQKTNCHEYKLTEETSWCLQTHQTVSEGAQGRNRQSGVHSMHVHTPAWDFASARVVHSAIAELIHPYNAIK